MKRCLKTNTKHSNMIQPFESLHVQERYTGSLTRKSCIDIIGIGIGFQKSAETYTRRKIVTQTENNKLEGLYA